jgi:hypothetical protein
VCVGGNLNCGSNQCSATCVDADMPNVMCGGSCDCTAC